LVISTVVPKTWSVPLLRVSLSAAGGSVVTLTSKGAKSSATRCQMAWMRCNSPVEKVPGTPSRSKGSAVIEGPVFQAVPDKVAPLKFR
jgi:hypothetical protein